MSELIDDFVTPAALKEEEKPGLRERIARLLKASNAVIVAWPTYYTDPEIQALAEATDGTLAVEGAMTGARLLIAQISDIHATADNDNLSPWHDLIRPRRTFSSSPAT